MLNAFYQPAIHHSLDFVNF